MSFASAIQRIFRALRRAMARMTEKWLEVGGKMIRMLVPSGAPIEMDEPEAKNAGEDEWAEFGAKVRALAGQLIGDGTPNADLMASLPPGVVRWLSVCDDSMLRGVMKAPDDGIKDHMQGRRYLRGVVCPDEASLDSYIRDMSDDLEMPEEELKSAKAWLPT